MRQAEVDILTELGWNPKGLIESTTNVMHITTGTGLFSFFSHPE
jgi:hypothetical protein